MSDCTRTVKPEDAAQLGEILSELPEGAVLCFSAGTYEGGLQIERSVTLRGSGVVILDGKHQRPTVQVLKKIELTIEGVTLRNGSGGGMGDGGNLSILKSQRVLVRDVVLEGGEAEANGGGAVLVRGGDVVLERCRMTKNRGARAQAVLVTGGAATLRECEVSGEGEVPAITAVAPARLTVERSNVAGAILADGAAGAAPEVTVEKSKVTAITVRSDAAPRVKVSGSTLQKALPAGAVDGGGNTVQ